MKWLRRGLIACAVVAVVGGCICLGVRASGPREPVYQGKPLGYWLKAYARNGAEAERVFREMDTNAVPFLVARLERDAIWDSRKEKFNALVDKWHLPASFKIANVPAFNSSTHALQLLGKSATPGLLRVFEETTNTNVINEAAQTLLNANRMWFGPSPWPGYGMNWNWSRFVMAQQTNLSPTAWKRLANATVFEESD